METINLLHGQLMAVEKTLSSSLEELAQLNQEIQSTRDGIKRSTVKQLEVVQSVSELTEECNTLTTLLDDLTIGSELRANEILTDIVILRQFSKLAAKYTEEFEQKSNSYNERILSMTSELERWGFWLEETAKLSDDLPLRRMLWKEAIVGAMLTWEDKLKELRSSVEKEDKLVRSLKALREKRQDAIYDVSNIEEENMEEMTIDNSSDLNSGTGANCEEIIIHTVAARTPNPSELSSGQWFNEFKRRKVRFEDDPKLNSSSSNLSPQQSATLPPDYTGESTANEFTINEAIAGTGYGVTHDGTGYGATHDGTGYGATHDGTGYGATHDGTGYGATHDGTGYGATHDGSGYGATHDGTGYGATHDGSGYGATHDGTGYGATHDGTGYGATTHTSPNPYSGQSSNPSYQQNIPETHNSSDSNVCEVSMRDSVMYHTVNKPKLPQKLGTESIYSVVRPYAARLGRQTYDFAAKENLQWINN